MQKIAGILKEDDDLDLSNLPDFKQSLKKLQDNPTYIDFSMPSPFDYRLFALLDRGGNCYLIDLSFATEGDVDLDDEEYIPELIRLKKGLTAEKIETMGKKKKFWEMGQFGNVVDMDKEEEMNAWLNSLKA